MAVIDLKNVTVKVRDGGTTLTSAVNFPVDTVLSAKAAATGNTVAGVSSLILVTGGLGEAHYIGEKFLITGDTTVYTLTRDYTTTTATTLFMNPGLKTTFSATKDITFQSGYGLAATRIATDAFTGTVTPGSIVNFSGETDDYVVVTGGVNPTSLVINPGLRKEVADDAVVTVSLPNNEITITMGDGDVSWTEKRTREYKLNRGKLDTVRDADEEPMDVSLNSLTWEFIRSKSGDTVPTLEEAIKRTGLAANWVSTSADPCEPYAVDIILENVPGCGNLGDSEVFILPDFRWESYDYNTSDGTVSISGKCNATEALKIRNIL